MGTKAGKVEQVLLTTAKKISKTTDIALLQKYYKNAWQLHYPLWARLDGLVGYRFNVQPMDSFVELLSS